MLFKSFSAAVFGIDAYVVEVEAHVGPGHPGDFNVVGLPDIAVKESRERVKAALRNCGFDYPSYNACRGFSEEGALAAHPHASAESRMWWCRRRTPAKRRWWRG